MLSWVSIVRLGLVQAALGAIVVLTTSTLNRVMVVELALPAIVPGALVTLHHAMQLLRPRMGHGSDVGERRTPWIVGGMAVLALGGFGAAAATAVAGTHAWIGLALAVVSFAAIGLGVSASGTSLLVLMAKRVAEERRAAAATVVWMMMIAGFAITATIAGKLLDPYTSLRLVRVAAEICGAAFIVSVLAIWRVEQGTASRTSARASREGRFVDAVREVWAERDARRFTAFVFVSMLAYSAQDLILEPFAGSIYAFTPGASTKLSGAQHGGVFAGMLLCAIVTSLFKRTPLASLKAWVIGGCLASALAMGGLVVAGVKGGGWPLRENVFVLGIANGAFSIAAIGSMMSLASQGRSGREGTRMGLWGAAQAIAFGAGGFVGTVLVDGAKLVIGPGGAAYAFVFGLEVVGFLAAFMIATGITFEPAKELVGLSPVTPEAINPKTITAEAAE